MAPASPAARPQQPSAMAMPADGDRLRNSAEDMMLAGIFGALAAAVPGIIDYLAVIPPDSSAKKRGVAASSVVPMSAP